LRLRGAIDRQVEADIALFRGAVKRLIAIPGARALGAQVVFFEIGLDMGRFPSDAHLQHLPKDEVPAVTRAFKVDRATDPVLWPQEATTCPTSAFPADDPGAGS